MPHRLANPDRPLARFLRSLAVLWQAIFVMESDLKLSGSIPSSGSFSSTARGLESARTGAICNWPGRSLFTEAAFIQNVVLDKCSDGHSVCVETCHAGRLQR